MNEYMLLALPCTLPFVRQYITKPLTKVTISDYGSFGKSKGMLCWICDCQSGPAACFHYFYCDSYHSTSVPDPSITRGCTTHIWSHNTKALCCIPLL